jgi:hypothetical protein
MPHVSIPLPEPESASKSLAMRVRACRLLLASVLGASCILPEVAEADLLHRWRADGDATDSAGDDDGDLEGGAGFEPSISGQGFSFDGVDDAAVFGEGSGNFGSSDFTIAFVIRTTSTGSVQGVLAKRSICGFSSFWDVRTSLQGVLSLEVYETNVNLGSGTVVPVNDGFYHTVVFTREGSVMTSYVDGLQRQRIDHGVIANLDNQAALVAGSGVCVGKDGTVPFSGLLDEIRLANHADPDILPAIFHCGDANKNAEVTATDALSTLRTAVGSHDCELCLCDINDNGTVTAADALAILRRSVGQQIPLLCELCPFELVD